MKKILIFLVTMVTAVLLLGPPVLAAEPLREPDGLSASTDVSGAVEISWQEVNGAESYRVYRMEYGSPGFTFLGTAAECSFTDETAKDLIIYQYSVSALQGEEEGPKDPIGCMGHTKFGGILDIQTDLLTKDTCRVSGEITFAEDTDHIAVAVWSYENGQDDLRWAEYPVVGDRFSFTVSTADHGGKSGLYWVHVYPRRADGTQSSDMYPCYVEFPETLEEPVLPDAESISENYSDIVIMGHDYGDAVLLASEGEYLMIDCGRVEDADQIMKILKVCGVDKVDILFSHTHSDHWGALPDLIEAGMVKSITTTDVWNRYYQDELAFEEYMARARAAGIPILSYPESGEVCRVGHFVISIAAPQMNFQADSLEMGNNNCVWLKVEAYGFTYLTIGDAEKAAQKAVLDAGIDLSADFVKIPHHGLINSLNRDFIDAVGAKAAFAMDVGQDTDDSGKSLSAWAEKTKVYATSTEGTIRLRLTDGAYEISTVRQTILNRQAKAEEERKKAEEEAKKAEEERKKAEEEQRKAEEEKRKAEEEERRERQKTMSFVYDGLDYGPVFDPEYYLSNYPDLRAAFGDDYEQAFEHFLAFGMREGRQASRYFNLSFYRDRYADLRSAFGGDWPSYYRHFLNHGISEGRLASSVKYEEKTEEKEEESQPEEKEPEEKEPEEEKPGEKEETKTYIAGGLDYSPIFDPEYYLSRYPDLRAAFGDNYELAFEHFLTFGANEFRQASASFDPYVYRARYADLRNAFGGSGILYYQHYLIHGIQEGRSGV